MWTIGHSTRSFEEFSGLLQTYAIESSPTCGASRIAALSEFRPQCTD